MKNKGIELFRQRSFEKARSFFINEINEDRNRAESIKFLGLCYLELDDMYKAEKYLFKASISNKDDADILTGLARVSIKKGDFYGAKGWLRKALHKTPDHEQAGEILADLEKNGG
ncbi:MAG: tetratricopeptide repeat protein [Vulcanimicrobiota bacterium]